MLIKPLTETRAPRNTFFDEDAEPLIPSITIAVQVAETYDFLVVVPQTISILSESFNGEQVGLISIEFANGADQSANTEEDYDDEEDLYNAIVNKVKYPVKKVPIIKHRNSLIITVPHFESPITYNILAAELTSTFGSTVGQWIILSPSSLNNNQSLNVLYNEEGKAKNLPHIKEIPFLKPPHFITGIGGSVVAKLNILSPEKVLSIVLNSEGQPGFEKSDSDSIMDAAFVISEIISTSPVEREDYVKKVSSTVRKFNGFSNSGMYI